MAGEEEALSGLIQRMADVLVPIVEAGMAEGLFRTDLPAPLVARVLFELHMAGHLLFYRPGVDLRLRAMQRRVAALDLLFRGVA